MTKLRDEAITHMAQAVHDSDVTDRGELPAWDFMPDRYTAWHRRGEAALDALLLFLTEHTEEWSVDGLIDADSALLLAALRGTTE